MKPARLDRSSSSVARRPVTRRPTTGVRRKRNRRTSTKRRILPGDFLKRSVLRTLSVVLGIAALVGVSGGAHYGWEALRASGRLSVQAIDIEGNARTTRKEIEAYGELATGSFIFDVDLDSVTQRLRRHPWVAQATVRRVLPNRLVVRITEQRPHLLVGLGDVYIANEHGHLFKRAASADRVTLPILTGLTRERFEATPEQAEGAVRDGISLLAQLSDSRLGRLEQMRWDEHLGWSVVVRPPQAGAKAALVHLGTIPSARVAVAARVFERAKVLGRDPAVIWADGKKSPARAQVRFHDYKTASSGAVFLAATETP